ncbi:MAG: YbaK/EbsC family protein [Sciscionella sp.]
MGSLVTRPASDRPDLLAPPVVQALSSWAERDHVSVAEIDPSYADTATFCERYGVPRSAAANCVVVSGSRGGNERIAACVVSAETRADVNNTVRHTLEVRRASFLPVDRAVAESGMEYGGITPMGLPDSWRLLVAPEVAAIEVAVIGSGVRGSKLLLPGRLLAALPGAEIVAGLARRPGCDRTPG